MGIIVEDKINMRREKNKRHWDTKKNKLRIK